MSKKRNLDVIHKTSLENTMNQIHMMSMSIGTGAYTGTGVYKNKKYDKKSRRTEGKRICREEY